MRYTVTQFARESVGLCPFRDSYVREFELSNSNPVNRVIKITQAYNLHVKAVTMFHVVHQIHVFWGGVGGGRYEKGLLNFVSERLRLVYRINNTRLIALQTSKTRTIYRLHAPELKSISKL